MAALPSAVMSAGGAPPSAVLILSFGLPAFTAASSGPLWAGLTPEPMQSAPAARAADTVGAKSTAVAGMVKVPATLEPPA